MSQGEEKAAPVRVGDLEAWALDPVGPVALCLRQTLLPVEVPVQGEGGVIAPPTYADIGYNVDTLGDGTRVALVDSVGSQANRLEPIFKADPSVGPEDWLVPQVDVVLRTEACGHCAECQRAASSARKTPGRCENPRKVSCSLLDLAHRAADAVVRATELRPTVEAAFAAMGRGDAGPLCDLAPTSLLFGVWDSRGASAVKRPRLVRSIIRAWDVDVLHAAAQFNSVWKMLDGAQQTSLDEAAAKARVRLSEVGLKDAPGVFRKGRTTVAATSDRRVLGGVRAHGPITREVTINLVALRGLRGSEPVATRRIRLYLFALALVAATADVDLFLREGCHLHYAGEDLWYQVPRRGPAQLVDLARAEAVRQEFVAAAVAPMRARWSGRREVAFDLEAAKQFVATAKAEDEGANDD